MKRCLLDTGALVAFFDHGDATHAAVVQWMAGFTGEFLTTGAVITEAFHLVADDTRAVQALAEFLQQPGIRIPDCFEPGALERASELMRKYRDVPMDFADATLVWLAEESGTESILTLDERGFRTFRHNRNRTFRLVLRD